jgi:hypothetical protein
LTFAYDNKKWKSGKVMFNQVGPLPDIIDQLPSVEMQDTLISINASIS